MKCNNCRFCSILAGAKKYDIVDTPILENNNYYLLSSIGAMVEGWSLVIPKEHSFSMRDYYSTDEFFEFTNKCIELIKSVYKTDEIMIFEHGANKEGSLTACGTEHSHLHLVPLKKSLLNIITKELYFEKIEIINVNIRMSKNCG